MFGRMPDENGPIAQQLTLQHRTTARGRQQLKVIHISLVLASSVEAQVRP